MRQNGIVTCKTIFSEITHEQNECLSYTIIQQISSTYLNDFGAHASSPILNAPLRIARQGLTILHDILNADREPRVYLIEKIN